MSDSAPNKRILVLATMLFATLALWVWGPEAKTAPAAHSGPHPAGTPHQRATETPVTWVRPKPDAPRAAVGPSPSEIDEAIAYIADETDRGVIPCPAPGLPDGPVTMPFALDAFVRNGVLHAITHVAENTQVIQPIRDEVWSKHRDARTQATHLVRYRDAKSSASHCEVEPLEPVEVVVSVVDEAGTPLEQTSVLLLNCGGPMRTDDDGVVRCQAHANVRIYVSMMPPQSGSLSLVPAGPGPLFAELVAAWGQPSTVRSAEPWMTDVAEADKDTRIAVAAEGATLQDLSLGAREFLADWEAAKAELRALSAELEALDQAQRRAMRREPSGVRLRPGVRAVSPETPH
jgi:hypothetical protein